MKRKLHTKTMAIMLATATVLQGTEIAPLLINGKTFVTANAATNPSDNDMGDVEWIAANNSVTTSPAVYLGTDTTEIVEPDLGLKDIVVKMKVLPTSNPDGIIATTTAQVRFSMDDEDTASAQLSIPAGTIFVDNNNKQYTLKDQYETDITVRLSMTESPTLPEIDYLTVYNTTTPGSIRLTWNKATDDRTSQDNLTYYLYEAENSPYHSIDDWESNATLLNGDYGSQDITEWQVNNINNTSVYYFQLIVKDQQGNKTRYSTESYTKAISQVKILRNRDSLEALVMNKLNHELFIDRNKISYNWSVDGVTIGTNKTLPLTEAYANKKISLNVNVEGYNDSYKADYLPSIDSIGFFRENNILSVDEFDINGNWVTGNDFKFTYEWLVDGTVVSTDKSINLDKYYDKQITVNVSVNDGEDHFSLSGSFKNINGVHSKISGIPQNGTILKAGINPDDKNLELKYYWWRLDNKDTDSIDLAEKEGKALLLNKTDGPEIVSQDNYQLTSQDIGKYIALITFFKDSDGKYRELNPMSVTEKIVEKASTGSHSSKKHSSSSSSSSSSNSSGSSSTESNSASGSNSSTASTTTNTAESSINIEKNQDGSTKLVDKNGQAATGWQQLNGKWYLADSNGIAQTGWKQADGKWYLLNTDGVMTTGWQQTNSKWYLLNSDGSMSTGWQTKDGKWYLLNNDGSMATGWQKVDSNWYYLNSDGSMASNTNIDGYTVNTDGALI